MLRTYLKMAAGLLCVLFTACSANIASNGFIEPLQPRFADNSNGTFTDMETHLTWTKDDNAPGPPYCWPGREKNIVLAEYYFECLNRNNYLGYNNWRMPTHKELDDLLCTTEVKNRTILKPPVCARLSKHDYWSSVDLAILIYKRRLMLYNLLGPLYIYNMNSFYLVWPVRSGN